MSKVRFGLVVAALSTMQACTTPNPDFCDDDTPCTDPATPFCDLAGEFGPSNSCTSRPAALDAAMDDAPAVDLPDATVADASIVGDANNADAGPTVPVTQIAAGSNHTCALFEDGTVACWGSGGNGRLGYGNASAVGDDEPASFPGRVDVGGVVTDIAAGGEHTCALLATGAVRCWGRNNAGQLGYGHTDDIGDDEVPSSAGDVPVGGAVSQVVAGQFFTCARLVGGGVRCWGDGSQGKLGYGNTDSIGDDESPSSAGDLVLGGTAVHLTAGNAHVCAQLGGGNVRCWGDGARGKLGYGNEDDVGDNEAPSAVGNVDVGGSVFTVEAGANHTCAILSTGSLRCWGLNNFGQLGLGNTSDIGDTEVPAAAALVDVGGVNVLYVVGGNVHTCALLTDRSVRCWGLGQFGRLGHGDEDIVGDDEAVTTKPVVAIGFDDFVNLMEAGGEHNCAVSLGGAVRCWGRGDFGALGYGNVEHIGDNEAPSVAGDVPVD